MSSYIHSELHENFLQQPSAVDDIVRFLGDVATTAKTGAKDDKKKQDTPEISARLTDANFLVTHRTRLGTKKSKSLSRSKITMQSNMNQMTFMRQIDVTPEERQKARTEREFVANNYRRLGNAEYRRVNYDKAIEFYTKGLCYINDSTVLLVNRALCYLKKRSFKMGLIDLDYVINKIDGCCLRAWLYKAAAMKRMNNEHGFDECVYSARKFNRFEQPFIDNFLEKLRTDF